MFIQPLVLVIAVVVAAQPRDKSPSVLPEENLAPLVNVDVPGVIREQYIVLFKADASADDVKHLKAAVQSDPKSTFLFAFSSGSRGFAARLSNATLELVRSKKYVSWVEADQKITATSVTEKVEAKGIDRIDRRLLPLDGRFQYSETGQGVHVYVFDTGIRATHEQFGDRASGPHHSIIDGGATDDCVGHGTHIAATIGGKDYGVARKVSLHAVRVVDCKNQGAVSTVIEGIDWLATNKIEPAVANLSIIAGGPSPALDRVIKESIESGVTYVVSAGNRADDACNYSPARVAEAITVGATTITNTLPKADMRFILSNYGRCLDLFAPGAEILSVGIKSKTGTETRSGASMAAAHVSGVAALYLENHPGATPRQVWEAIHANNNVSTTPGWGGIRSAGIESPNELLHWGPFNAGHDDEPR